MYQRTHTGTYAFHPHLHRFIGGRAREHACALRFCIRINIKYLSFRAMYSRADTRRAVKRAALGIIARVLHLAQRRVKRACFEKSLPKEERAVESIRERRPTPRDPASKTPSRSCTDDFIVGVRTVCRVRPTEEYCSRSPSFRFGRERERVSWWRERVYGKREREPVP